MTLLPVGQRMGQLGLFKLGIDRRLGEELELERLEGRFAILLQPLGVGLGLLLGQPDEVRAISKSSRVKGVAALEVEVGLDDLGGDLLGLGDLVPGGGAGRRVLGRRR